MSFLGQEDGFVGGPEAYVGYDTTPDDLGLLDRLSIARSAVVTSNTVTVAGINSSVALSIDAGEYSINGSGWTSHTTGSASISVNDTIQLRTTASASYATAVVTAVSINGSPFASWSVTTVGAPATVTQSNASELSADQPLLFSLLGIGPFSSLLNRRR